MVKYWSNTGHILGQSMIVVVVPRDQDSGGEIRPTVLKTGFSHNGGNAFENLKIRWERSKRERRAEFVGGSVGGSGSWALAGQKLNW